MGDRTGAEVQRVLSENAAKHPNIEIIPHNIAIDLIVDYDRPEPEVCGVYALDVRNNKVESYAGAITMLAAGGSGKVYLYTSNPDVATGDGIAYGLSRRCSGC